MLIHPTFGKIRHHARFLAHSCGHRMCVCTFASAEQVTRSQAQSQDYKINQFSVLTMVMMASNNCVHVGTQKHFQTFYCVCL